LAARQTRGARGASGVSGNGDRGNHQAGATLPGGTARAVRGWLNEVAAWAFAPPGNDLILPWAKGCAANTMATRRRAAAVLRSGWPRICPALIARRCGGTCQIRSPTA